MNRSVYLTLLAMCWLIAGCSDPQGPESSISNAETTPDNNLNEQLGGDSAAGYRRAIEARQFNFPEDHAPHSGFRNEWWYFTGNLHTEEGRRFGYQVTFFRIALSPDTQARASAWATRHIWMAHLAVTDPQGVGHRAVERLTRGAAGLAGSETSPLRLWVENWNIEYSAQDRWQIDASGDAFSLKLELEPVTDIVLQGDQGLSRKSTEPGNASYYYSIPRLQTKGHIEIDGEQHRITGLSWLDREWSTSVLGEDQVGWDWFALQFDDGRDLMYYQLRRDDGSADPMSAGSLSGNGRPLRRLSGSDLSLRPLTWWTAADGRRYPIRWSLTLDGEPLRVEAVIEDQQMEMGVVRYWEGMVLVRRASDDTEIGRGYLELAGY